MISLRARLAYWWELKLRARREARLNVIVKSAIDHVLAIAKDSSPAIFTHLSYGAIGINPRHLVIWYVFHTDADLKAATETDLTRRLDKSTRTALAEKGYPADFVSIAHIGFVSDEDIQKRSGGNYFYYFK
jgi:hypothetical protein